MKTQQLQNDSGEGLSRSPNPTVRQAAHSPLPWQIINGGLFDDSASMVFPAATKRDEANVRLIVESVNGYSEAIQALRDLTAEIKLGTLNVRKDFSLMVAHASATKVLHKYDASHLNNSESNTAQQ